MPTFSLLDWLWDTVYQILLFSCYHNTSGTCKDQNDFVHFFTQFFTRSLIQKGILLGNIII